MFPAAPVIVNCIDGNEECNGINVALAIPLPELSVLRGGARLIKLGKIGKKGAEIWEKASGLKQAEKDFKALTAAEKVKGATKVKEYADGTKAVLHTSSTTGLPTITIQNPDGSIMKFRYY